MRSTAGLPHYEFPYRHVFTYAEEGLGNVFDGVAKLMGDKNLRHTRLAEVQKTIKEIRIIAGYYAWCGCYVLGVVTMLGVHHPRSASQKRTLGRQTGDAGSCYRAVKLVFLLDAIKGVTCKHFEYVLQIRSC